ncbi:MAG: malectin domain-containing carbohydrate-binding protein [Pseudomonadota bacterium]
MPVRNIRKDESGNIAMISAIFLPALIAVAGVALDYTNAANHRASLHFTTDAAAIMVASMDGDATLTQREDAALDFIEANFADAGSLFTLSDVKVTEDTAGIFALNVTGTVDTTLAQIFGIDSVPLEVSAKASQGSTGTVNGVEIAMTMDVTASMSFPTKDGGTSSSEEAYAAIEAALATLSPLSGDENFYVSFFPLADRMNVGSDFQHFVTFGDFEDNVQDSIDAYDAQVAADEAAAAEAAQPTGTLYRVASGSNAVTAIDGGLQWGQDSRNSNSPYLIESGSNNSAGTSASIDLSLVSDYNVPEAIFKTERWEGSGGDEMEYAFNVEAGTEVEVRLYLAETWSGANARNKRVFDVEVDGSVPSVFNDIDQYKLAGDSMDKAIVVTHQLVSDGTVNLEFIHQIQNPAVKGIEIVSLEQEQTEAPTTPAGEEPWFPPIDDTNYFGEVTSANWDKCVHPRYLGDVADYDNTKTADDIPWFLSDNPPAVRKVQTGEDGNGDPTYTYETVEGGVNFRAHENSHQYANATNKPACNSQELIGPSHDLDDVFNILPGLRKAGTGRFDVAMAWGWRLLSPQWQNAWGYTGYPEDPETLALGQTPRRKIMLMFTDAHTTAFHREFGYDMTWGYNNSTPEQMTNLKAICDGAKADGVEIYIFHVLGNDEAEVVDAFRDCAGADGTYSQDVDDYYHQIVTFEDLEVGLGSMTFQGSTPLLIE